MQKKDHFWNIWNRNFSMKCGRRGSNSGANQEKFFQFWKKRIKKISLTIFWNPENFFRFWKKKLLFTQFFREYFRQHFHGVLRHSLQFWDSDAASSEFPSPFVRNGRESRIDGRLGERVELGVGPCRWLIVGVVRTVGGGGEPLAGDLETQSVFLMRGEFLMRDEQKILSFSKKIGKIQQIVWDISIFFVIWTWVEIWKQN